MTETRAAYLGDRGDEDQGAIHGFNHILGCICPKCIDQTRAFLNSAPVAHNAAMTPTYEELAAAIRDFVRVDQLGVAPDEWYQDVRGRLRALAARLPRAEPFAEQEVNGEVR